MIRFFWSGSFAILTVLLAVPETAAQTRGTCPQESEVVQRPACPADTTFADGNCHRAPNWLGHRSYCRLQDCHTCRADEVLVPATGVCTSTRLRFLGTPACPSDTTFRDGNCHRAPNWLGHRSYCRLQDCAVCREDQILDTVNGLCCAPP